MIKFVAELPQGQMYGFGLTEANLNRLEFNNEPIFFDFGYAGHPKLFGLFSYLGKYQEPIDIAENIDAARENWIPFFDLERGITPETLRVFPIAWSIMEKFRSTPFWGFETQITIANPNDMQLIFSGRTGQEIEQYLQKGGLMGPQTKYSSRGFGKQH